jgi:DNA polymerase III delta prime subunit
MKNRYALRIIIFSTLLITNIRCASSSMDPLSMEAQRARNNRIIRGISDDKNLNKLLVTYRANLPSVQRATQHIEQITLRHPEWTNKFARKMHHLQNPDEYKPAKYPSRMLYHGPSGCGKVLTALALAKKCNTDCLLIHGSSIETSYRRSGSDFLVSLFQTLLKHPERRFLVIFNEFGYLAKFAKDERDVNQHLTVKKMWQCLDQIENEGHICVVAIDNQSPKEYEKPMQTRFFNNIFKFRHNSGDTLPSTIFASELSPYNLVSDPTLDVTDHSITASKAPWTIVCNFDGLNQYTSSVSHLSKREKLILAQTSLEIAIYEKLMQGATLEDRNITITLEHCTEALRGHKRSFLQRLCAHPTIQNIFSMRSLSYCLISAGLGLRVYDTKFTPHSLVLQATAHIINTLNSDLQLFSALNIFGEGDDKYQRFQSSLDQQQAALNLDAEQYRQSRIDHQEDLERDQERYDESRENRARALERDQRRYDKSRRDHEADLELDDERYKELQKDLSADRERDKMRHEQHRKNRESDIELEVAQFQAHQEITMRGQYLNMIDIVLDNLATNLTHVENTMDVHQRAPVIEKYWTEFESALFHELEYRQHVIERTEGLHGQPLHDYAKNNIVQFYRHRNRVIPTFLTPYLKN